MAAPLHIKDQVFALNRIGLKLKCFQLIYFQAEDENGKTAEQIAEDVKEEEMAAFLKACATGKIPAKAPAAKVITSQC